MAKYARLAIPAVGLAVGVGVGIAVGTAVGADVFATVGAGVGSEEGAGVGIGVGAGVGMRAMLTRRSSSMSSPSLPMREATHEPPELVAFHNSYPVIPPKLL